MATAVTKEVDKRFAAACKDKEDATPAPMKDEARAYIMALLEDNTKKAEISGSLAKPKVTLKSIISKAKNAKS
jgi:citrate lyase beta subunit